MHAAPEVINVVPQMVPITDPRAVPVSAVDSDLPAVPVDRLSAQALRRRFASPPVWTPELRREPLCTHRVA